MRRWTALELIEIGESGASLGPAGRALLLLEAGGMPRDAAEALSLGQRDRALFALRARQFGARLEVGQRCPECGADYEFTLTAADLGRDTPGEAAPPATVEGVAVRALTAGDLALGEGQGDAEAARALLRRRVAPGGDAIGDAALDAALAALDPDAELAIAARCPECGQAADIVFDIAAFFWDEIILRVPRLLQQVADLARVNHWSERDILSLPPARRRFYLTAAGA
ncbi:hypothetical protein EAO27_06170 [Sphingopyxis sp. YF1]|uniref:hypothetical protein n=1 Tax=Sphingopyxis sp. YF1 TaxID=2482763 RepID=UPI001F602AEB|nr:hypothetical protein [Sphingopyxis sp. YF1]UNU42340.1 hypothetical protein EAO27_06170 [Sphingopyxis sp. YF1]